MKRNTDLYIKDILECIDLLYKYTAGKTEYDLERNIELRDAVMLRIGIIGEAASQLPDAFKKAHPHIPWKAMVNMRNVLIHQYFGVYLDRLFTVIKKDLPVLQKQLQEIVQHKAQKP